MALLGRSPSAPSAPSIEIDTGLGVELSVARLARLGRTRLAHVNAPEHYNYGLERMRAFRASVAGQASIRQTRSRWSGTSPSRADIGWPPRCSIGPCPPTG